MSMPKVSLSPDDATGLVHVKAEWTFDPARMRHTSDIVEPVIRELTILLDILDGQVPTEKVAT